MKIVAAIQRVMALALLLFACSLGSLAAKDAPGAPKRYLIEFDGRDSPSYPSADFDLGDVKGGETVNAEVTFRNVSNESFVFTNARTNCICQDLHPSSGTLAPGEELLLRFGFRVPASPRLLELEDSITLENGNEVAYFLNFKYRYAHYLGFPSGTLSVTYDPERMNDPVVFDVPLTIGDRVERDEYEFSLGGLPGTFEAVKVSGQPAMRVTYRHADGESQRSDPRLFGTASLVDLRDMREIAMPLMLVPLTELRVMPRVIRFVASDDQSYVATVFIRHIDRADRKREGDPSGRWLDLAASIGPMQVQCNAASLRAGLAKADLRLTDRDLEALHGDRTLPQSVLLKGKLFGVPVNESLSFLIKETTR